MNFKVDKDFVQKMKLKYMIEEFNNIDDNNKFLPNTTYKLPNNQDTFNWFFDNINIIYSNAESKDIFDKTIDDFEKFILVEERAKKAYIKKEFIKKLYEFSINKSNSKFKKEDKDSIWFYNNMQLLFSSKNPVSISIQKEYINYININEEMIKRLNTFLNEEKVDKFSINDCTLKFDDGINYAVWFYTSFDKILGLKTKESKELLNQYSKYIMKDLIEEFLYKDYRKFYNINIKFSNNMSMLEFWLNNKDIILNSNNLVCKNIKKEYFNYLNKYSEINKCVEQDIKNITKEDEIKYFDLVEFYNESNNLKFIFNCQTSKIGNLEASKYFYKNIEEIFENKNNYLLYDAIKKQFCDSLFYKSIDDASNRCDFYEKLIKFYNEESLNKFSYIQSFCFEDDVNMHKWFYSNKIRIFSTDDYYCLKIVEQLLKYKNQEKAVKYIEETFKDRICKK